MESTRLSELESLIGAVPGMIYRTRLSPPYDSEFLSEEAGTVVGYPARDFVGADPKRQWSELIHPDDRERVRQELMDAPADGTIAEVEYRVRRADGSFAWILSRCRKVVEPDGTAWLNGAAIDVTARHEAEELARRLEAERARTTEIEASRARIVEAGYEARRQLERDLHDGAQQRLVVAALTLKRAVLKARGTGSEPLVNEAFELLQKGLADLRDIARGIHPAVLSERGLATAIEGLAARSPIPVEVRVVRRRVQPAVEAAIYFTVAEALTNVARYARATHATVDVALDDGSLVARVVDDGVGGARIDKGSGLRGLADRLDALGGTLSVESPRGRGTTVSARAPLRVELEGDQTRGAAERQ